MTSRLPRLFALSALAFGLLGCGGRGVEAPPVDPGGQMELVIGGSGSQSYAVTFSYASDTNADVTPFDTSNPLTFGGTYLRSAFVGDTISWTTNRAGQSLTLGLVKASHVAVGDTFNLGEGSINTLQCADNGTFPHGYFRRWRSVSGTARVVALSDSMVEVVAEGVRLESSGGQTCGDGGCIDNTARGGFTVDLTARFPRFSGSARFSDGVDTNVDMSEFDTTQLDVIASSARLWDYSYSASLWISGDPSYRSVTVSLKPTDRRLKPGDIYDLATPNAQIECVNGTRPNDPYVWTSQSGKATVVSIQGNLVTVKVESAVMKPKAGEAKGTFTINATLVTPTN